MEQFKVYWLSIAAFLFFQVGLAQKNDSHIVPSPTKRLKMILYSGEKPVVEGSVIAVKNKLINDGMFVIYRQDGFILQTIQYDMGKIIKITNFSEDEKM